MAYEETLWKELTSVKHHALDARYELEALIMGRDPPKIPNLKDMVNLWFAADNICSGYNLKQAPDNPTEKTTPFEAVNCLRQLIRWCEEQIEYLAKHPEVQEAISKRRVHKLNDTEHLILASLSKHGKLTGAEVAKSINYSYSTTVKGTLTSLRKRGLIDNEVPGYVLTDQGHDVCQD